LTLLTILSLGILGIGLFCPRRISFRRAGLLPAGVVQPLLDALALELLDVLELLHDVIHDTVQVVALHALLAHLLQALHHILQAHAMVAVAPHEALLHQAIERLTQLARLHVLI